MSHSKKLLHAALLFSVLWFLANPSYEPLISIIATLYSISQAE